MVRTALDEVTTLRDPETKIPTAPAPETPRATPQGPQIGAPGQGQQRATNPIRQAPGQGEYEAMVAKYQEEQKAKQGTTTTTGGAAGMGGPASGSAKSIIDKAMQYVGTPYVWGGSSPLGFDCSGFTQYVFRQFGVNLPRVSAQQGFGGRAVNAADAQPGDLIFWDNSTRNNGADHVGIYLGNGKFVAAPKPGDHVKVSSVYGKYWFRRYL